MDEKWVIMLGDLFVVLQSGGQRVVTPARQFATEMDFVQVWTLLRMFNQNQLDVFRMVHA